MGKALEIYGIQEEYLKQGLEVFTRHIKIIFNEVIHTRSMTNWITSVVIPLLRSVDVNNPSNYYTIIINLLFGKLFGSMIEKQISVCDKKEGEREIGLQAKTFYHRPLHYTQIIDQKDLEKQGGEVFFYFVDFKKVFDVVPRSKLWSRMEELEIPKQYRLVVHRQYD